MARLESVLSWVMGVGCATAAPAAVPVEQVVIPRTSVRFEVARVSGGGHPYWIGRREVTWEEMALLTEASAADAVTRPTKAQSYLIEAPPPRDSLLPDRPVINVRWHSAMSYCAWLSTRTGDYYRLPTEREWDLAARAAATAPLDESAWHRGNSAGTTHAVGGKKPNALGLYDILGNVSEYCLESQSPPDYGPVLKGGSWDTPAADLGPERREPVRFYRADPGLPQSIWWVSGGFFQGFRVVRVPGAASAAEVEAYARRVGVRIADAKPRTSGKGGAVQFFVRVRGEVENVGDRTLTEVQLVLYPMTPRGRPHWVDSGSAEKPGRATFTWCHPVLRNGSGEQGRPLAPGERRPFEADVPESFDDEKQQVKDSFKSKVTALCFAD